MTWLNCITRRLKATLLSCVPNAQLGCRQSRIMDAHTSARNVVARRRSQRIALRASIEVCGEDRQKCTFTLGAVATNLNRHGAAIQVDRDLAVGATVQVRNGRGAQAVARVVAQVKALHGIRTYGIEFLEKNDRLLAFWGITFPPEPAKNQA